MSDLKKKSIVLLLVLSLLLTLSSCVVNSLFTRDEKLSETMIGEWKGDLDVAKFCYKELGEELGLDISPDPIYCDIYLSFYDDGKFLFKVDIDSFGRALGEWAEPYMSALFGFDTGFIVDLIMQYVANEIPVDSGEEWGTYMVDDSKMTVTLVSKAGEEETIELTEDGRLEFYEEFWGQVLSFEHQ